MSTEDLRFSPSRFRALRSANRLTFQDLADALNVSKTTVHQWESGKSSPSDKNFAALAKFLGVKIKDLSLGTEMFEALREALDFDNEGHNVPAMPENTAIRAEDTTTMRGLKNSLTPSVLKVISECQKLSNSKDTIENFIVDCIYHRWNALNSKNSENTLLLYTSEKLKHSLYSLHSLFSLAKRDIPENLPLPEIHRDSSYNVKKDSVLEPCFSSFRNALKAYLVLHNLLRLIDEPNAVLRLLEMEGTTFHDWLEEVETGGPLSETLNISKELNDPPPGDDMSE